MITMYYDDTCPVCRTEALHMAEKNLTPFASFRLMTHGTNLPNLVLVKMRR